MNETLQEYEQPQPARPIFLTVLCILTFVGSGWGFFSGIIKYATAEKQAAMVSLTKDKATSDMQKSGNEAGRKFAEQMVGSLPAIFTADNIKKVGLSETVGALLCLAGAFLMWKMKKTGFYLYVLGTLVGTITPFVIYGAGNMIAIISTVFIGFFGVVFLILYGLNFKHLK